jgi:hypothetical protein
MLGYNHLGKLGQLGNQMFQYASLRGIAANKGYEFCIPDHNELVIDILGNKLRIEIDEPFVLKNCEFRDNVAEQYVQEPGFAFSQELYDSCPDNVSLVGYFQTDKYFDNIADEIREDFTFKDEILEPCKEMMSGLNAPIALHIRRGDFIKNSGNHHNLDIDYYRRALEMFPSNRNVAIFSDDPQWCKEQELFDNDRFLIATGNSSYVDLCLMTLCSDFIIANSTYNNQHLDTKDLYPTHWEIING